LLKTFGESGGLVLKNADGQPPERAFLNTFEPKMGLFTSPNVPVIFVRFGTKLALFIQHYVAAGDSFSTLGPIREGE